MRFYLLFLFFGWSEGEGEGGRQQHLCKLISILNSAKAILYVHTYRLSCKNKLSFELGFHVSSSSFVARIVFTFITTDKEEKSTMTGEGKKGEKRREGRNM